MSKDVTRASGYWPPALGVALGQIRYRSALALISFGVLVGWLLACILPLCIFESYFDAAVPANDAFRWTLTAGTALTAAALTYRCRRWIVRKASEEAPPEPVSGAEIANAAFAVVQSALAVVGFAAALIATVIALIIAGLLIYGGYLLLTALSVTMAILIGAGIIALALLVAASR